MEGWFMKRTLLLERAECLATPPVFSAMEFSAYRPELVQEVHSCLKNLPDYQFMLGMASDMQFRHELQSVARLLENMFHEFYAEVFVETVLWLHSDFINKGFKLSLWIEQFLVWSNVIRRRMTQESFEALDPFFCWLREYAPLTTAIASLLEVHAEEPVLDES